VTLNGKVRSNPEVRVSIEHDCMEVDGQRVLARSCLYWMLNKPRGLVTSTQDERGRDTIYSCLKADAPWLAPVGRLDKASEGMLLLTNDTEWGARIAAPETHLEKRYHVQIATVAGAELLTSLRKGITMPDGEALRVKQAEVRGGGARNCWVEIVLEEGRNRHIRRMFEQLGIPVLRLVRVAIGPLLLGDLPKGGVRPLTTEEKSLLDQAMGRKAERPRRLQDEGR
jgi:23S rRNA pseudouridine2605 synthase